MRQERIGATGEHRRHPPPVGIQATMAHRVDAVMNPVQRPGRCSLLHRRLIYPQAPQLIYRDQSVLPLSDLGNVSIPPCRRPPPTGPKQHPGGGFGPV
ncbi:MAG TPA: hypothetical protein VGH58_07185, partial [Solirubrobacterales bacterium]